MTDSFDENPRKDVIIEDLKDLIESLQRVDFGPLSF